MEEALLAEYGDGETQLSIAYPERWDETEGLLGTLVALLAPVDDPRDFRANVNVVIDTPDSPTSVEEVAQQHGSALVAALDEARLLDTATVVVGGRDASRVLITYPLDGEDLTLEQWIVPLGRRNVVVSATSSNTEYPALTVDFQDIIASVSFDV